MPPKIFSPSRGKTGTRLKIAREIFIKIKIENTGLREEIPGKKRIIKDKTRAKVRLEIGPIRAIKAESLRGERKL